MQALFVHGMGRSPRSGWPLLWSLQRAGLTTNTFRYSAGLADCASITQRLTTTITALAAQGDYVVIGHSLGGVLLRVAVNTIPPDIRPPHHVFLLGSPLHAVCLAQQFSRHPLYRLYTGDCGQLLSSATRMAAIEPLAAPTTSIVGVLGWPWPIGPFNGELNDSLVSISEVSANWITDQVRVPIIHTLLPASPSVAAIIVERLAEHPAKHQASLY